ncbi:DUF2948 family protein [Methylobacterium marchantiae]|uniref:DUF2948 family protein n=1 Tax=Methylobacterium marchantiae TaxID=600331 RepID=A0ABW3WUD8_9HYPH|nr:hypothetical protein AIGOOFII_0515 [Methylobacterium marchantiae]
MELLKLAALDAEDLAILSAHLQDAVLRPQDLAYLAPSHRFVLVGRRFDWSAPEGTPPRRRLTALHFERVMAVRARGLAPGAPSSKPLDLLAITFDPKEDPSGTITLVFAGKAAIQLDVECIEARLKDLGPVWEVEGRPDHEAAEAGRAAIQGHASTDLSTEDDARKDHA